MLRPSCTFILLSNVVCLECLLVPSSWSDAELLFIACHALLLLLPLQPLLPLLLFVILLLSSAPFNPQTSIQQPEYDVGGSVRSYMTTIPSCPRYVLLPGQALGRVGLGWSFLGHSSAPSYPILNSRDSVAPSFFSKTRLLFIT